MLTNISLISKDGEDSGSYNFIYTFNMKVAGAKKMFSPAPSPHTSI